MKEKGDLAMMILFLTFSMNLPFFSFLVFLWAHRLVFFFFCYPFFPLVFPFFSFILSKDEIPHKNTRNLEFESVSSKRICRYLKTSLLRIFFPAKHKFIISCFLLFYHFFSKLVTPFCSYLFTKPCIAYAKSSKK